MDGRKTTFHPQKRAYMRMDARKKSLSQIREAFFVVPPGIEKLKSTLSFPCLELLIYSAFSTERDKRN